MSQRRSSKWVGALHLIVVGAALAAAGCGANLSPVLNLTHVPVATVPPGVDPTAFVPECIVRGVASRGWQVKQDAPGVVIATIQRADLSATVDIPYTATDYSILHRESSPGFKFDGQRIHKHYNQWIDRLRASIEQELHRPRGAPGQAASI